MRKLTIGILSHVDAGKTTLCENILYQSNTIKTLGRVDNKDSYFDNQTLERQRGITIFSKQANFQWKDMCITLLDTPGHVDFSAEMERTLQVLDYAVLLINAADGVKGHTKTLWKLLQMYHIPTFLFVNKMDQAGTDTLVLRKEVKSKLSDACIDFTAKDRFEEMATINEAFLETFLESTTIPNQEISCAIAKREIFPVYFGSALKEQGITEFLDGIALYSISNFSIQKKQQEVASLKSNFPSNLPISFEFGARVFKISRDDKGNRLTHVKITSGSIGVKEKIHILKQNQKQMETTLDEEKNPDELQTVEEKINEIRLYSGEKYELQKQVFAGDVVAFTGLVNTQAGMGLGIEKNQIEPILQPVMSYELVLPKDIDRKDFMGKLLWLLEEDPQLNFSWDGKYETIHVKIMGEIQLEILKSLIAERYHVEVDFSDGKILYKETITNTVEGVGHFEPLRHYAEVHILLRATERGSGITYRIDCSEDELAKNYQKLILTHLKEKEHLGVLTKSPITDVELTVIGGRAHLKHTEGGDFREATYRAIRQGLMQTGSILLEPYYAYQLEVPTEFLGRAISDLMNMHATHQIESSNDQTSVLAGEVPVVTMQNYQKILQVYTKGAGTLSCMPNGYRACHNEKEVVERYGYECEHDMENPTGSVFCSHGAGFYVPWDEVFSYMHVKDAADRYQKK